ncbi:MAG: DUF928 domain-containing protein [Cyanobacteria bacterium J06642_11]
MNSMRHPVIISTVLALITLTSYTPPAYSHTQSVQPDSLSHTLSNNLIANRLRGFRRGGWRASRYRRGGFARGRSCPAEELMAITPRMPAETTTVRQPPAEGTALEAAPIYPTASDRPTFYLYTPSLPAAKGLLTIQSDQEALSQRYSYETEFTLSGESGIVGIRLPEAAPALELGKQYVWQVSISCAGNDISNSLTTVGGVIERVADTDGTPTERLTYYFDQGIWQDALTVVAEQRFKNPSDRIMAGNWSTLMEASQLEQFIATPVIEIVDGQP